MKKIGIITGASSGMGRRFAETAGEEFPLDELWVIARREDRLKALAKDLSIPIRPLALDLSDRKSYQVLEALLKEEAPDVRLVVNASGFGFFESTLKKPLADNLNMMDLDCGAVMAVCQLCLPYMHQGGKILNIASVAAFQPIPYINVYASCKAFVLSYSRGLSRELKKAGITVTALCPFWTKTEFFNRAIRPDTDPVVKTYAAMYDADDLVKRGWRDLKRGKDVSKYGFVARAQAGLCKILPHSLIMDIWIRQQKLKDRA